MVAPLVEGPKQGPKISSPDELEISRQVEKGRWKKKGLGH